MGPFFSLILILFLIGIVQVALKAVRVGLLIPHHVPLHPSPSPHPGGRGTLIPPLVPALGVTPDHGLVHHRDEYIGPEVEGCTGTACVLCSSGQ